MLLCWLSFTAFVSVETAALSSRLDALSCVVARGSIEGSPVAPANNSAQGAEVQYLCMLCECAFPNNVTQYANTKLVKNNTDVQARSWKRKDRAIST
jgi:hypothetical protein